MDFIDRGVLSSFFNSNGYVLDFSNSSFDTFTSQSINIAIQQKYGLSKGASLTKFTEEEKETLVIKLYKDLFRYFDINFGIKGNDPGRIDHYNRCKSILDKSSNIPLDIPSIRTIGRDYIRELAKRAEKDIENNEFDTTTTMEEQTYYKTDNITRYVWKVKVEHGLSMKDFGSDIERRNEYYKEGMSKYYFIDATTGEIIGGDIVRL